MYHSNIGLFGLVAFGLSIASGCDQQRTTLDLRADRDDVAMTDDDTDSGTALDTSVQESEPSGTKPQDEPGSDSDTPTHSATGERTSDETSPETNESVTDTSSMADADGDGWMSGPNLDCDDANPDVNPGRAEVAGNGIDDNCNGSTDEEVDTTEPECDGQEFDIELLPTNLMILLDRSLSMGDTDYSPTKWEQARTAITSLVTDFDGDVAFGLDVFPDDGYCGVNAPVVRDVAIGNTTSIIADLADLEPGGQTPLCVALRKLADAKYAPGLQSGEAGNYLVLISDGEDMCGGSNCNWLGNAGPSHMTSAAEFLLSKGIRTFVIGFGDGVSPSQLNAIAAAGGTSFTTYLDAADEAELHDALSSIASSIASCSFGLKSLDASADPEKVNFFFDGVPVPHNPGCSGGSGWDWTDSAHTSVTFCEEACQTLQTGSVGQISAEFGCKQVSV